MIVCTAHYCVQLSREILEVTEEFFELRVDLKINGQAQIIKIQFISIYYSLIEILFLGFDDGVASLLLLIPIVELNGTASFWTQVGLYPKANAKLIWSS